MSRVRLHIVDLMRISAGFSAPSARRSVKSAENGANRRPGPRQSRPEPHIQTVTKHPKLRSAFYRG